MCAARLAERRNAFKGGDGLQHAKASEGHPCTGLNSFCALPFLGNTTPKPSCSQALFLSALSSCCRHLLSTCCRDTPTVAAPVSCCDTRTAPDAAHDSLSLCLQPPAGPCSNTLPGEPNPSHPLHHPRPASPARATAARQSHRLINRTPRAPRSLVLIRECRLPCRCSCHYL